MINREVGSLAPAYRSVLNFCIIFLPLYVYNLIFFLYIIFLFTLFVCFVFFEYCCLLKCLHILSGVYSPWLWASSLCHYPCIIPLLLVMSLFFFVPLVTWECLYSLHSCFHNVYRATALPLFVYLPLRRVTDL